MSLSRNQRNQLTNQVTSLVASANQNFTGLRVVPLGTAEKVVERSLQASADLPSQVQQHRALTDLSKFITLFQHNKVVGRSAENSDLLPIGHPLSTKKNSFSHREKALSVSRWISSDSNVHTPEAASLIASLMLSKPGSPEYIYYRSRISALPNNELPQKSILIASVFSGGNSSAARRARALLQRRDRKGQFAFMGGGMRALVRIGRKVRSLTGRIVSATDTHFDISIGDGRKIARIPATSGEMVKAVIPSPDGYSPTEADYDASDPIINAEDVEIMDAPANFFEDTDYKPSSQVKKTYGQNSDYGTLYSDGAYDVLVFDEPNAYSRDIFEVRQQEESEGMDVSTKGMGENGFVDPDLPVFFVRRRGSEDDFFAGQSWADVQAAIEKDDPDALSKPDLDLPEPETDTSETETPDIPNIVPVRDAGSVAFESEGGDWRWVLPYGGVGRWFLTEQGQKKDPDQREPIPGDPFKDYIYDKEADIYYPKKRKKTKTPKPPESPELPEQKEEEDETPEPSPEPTPDDVPNSILDDAIANMEQTLADAEAAGDEKAADAARTALDILKQAKNDYNDSDETSEPELPEEPEPEPEPGPEIEPIPDADEEDDEDLLEDEEDDEPEVDKEARAKNLKDRAQAIYEALTSVAERLYDSDPPDEFEGDEVDKWLEDRDELSGTISAAAENIFDLVNDDGEVDEGRANDISNLLQSAVDQMFDNFGPDEFTEERDLLFSTDAEYTEFFDDATDPFWEPDAVEEPASPPTPPGEPESKKPTAPDGYFQIPDGDYEPVGAAEGQESEDFTDDPTELAQKFDAQQLASSLTDAVSPDEFGDGPSGVGYLPFSDGDEEVPAHAIYEALVEAGVDPDDILKDIYGQSNDPDYTDDDEEKATVEEAGERFVPPLLEGLTEQELNQFLETGVYEPYLPENTVDSLLDPDTYDPFTDEEKAEAGIPDYVYDNPLELAEFMDEDMLEGYLRDALDPESEVPGYAGVWYTNPDDEDDEFTINLAGEAIRDALQLKGVDTNELINDILNEEPEELEPSDEEATDILDSEETDDVDSGDGEEPPTEVETAEPEGPRVISVPVSELQPGDVTTSDNFVIEAIESDAESESKGKLWAIGYYAGHATQKTKMWNPDTNIEVIRGLSDDQLPPKGDLPPHSKPSTYLKSWGPVKKNPDTGKYELKNPEDQAAYDAAWAEYNAETEAIKDRWSAPIDVPKQDPPVTPKNPAAILYGVKPSDLQPGDVTFKEDPDREYFVVQSVDGPDPDKKGRVLVTGYYPGHQPQQKSWGENTPIDIVRGASDVPESGDKPAIERPFAADDKYGGGATKDENGQWVPKDPEGRKKFLEDKAAFEQAKKESGESWTPPVDINTPPPKPGWKPSYPPFSGERIKQLIAQAGGDVAKFKELLYGENLLFIDFETTGFDTPGNKPIKITIRKLNGEEFSRFINPQENLGEFYDPEKKSPDEILKDSNGNVITDEFLADQPTIAELFDEIKEFIGEDGILVAHNALFEDEIITSIEDEIGDSLFTRTGIVDTLTLARALQPKGKNNLAQVAKRYGFTKYTDIDPELSDDPIEWHDSDADALVLPAILDKMLDELGTDAQLTAKDKAFNVDKNNSEFLDKYLKWNTDKSKYEEFVANQAASEALSKGLAGEKPGTLDEVIDKAKPKNLEVNEVESTLGGFISNDWVNDDNNTTDIGLLRPIEFQVGDFLKAPDGGWREVLGVSEPDEDGKVVVSVRYLSSGIDGQTKPWFAYNKNFVVRRRNGLLTGGEGESSPIATDDSAAPTPEPTPSPSPSPDTDEVIEVWETPSGKKYNIKQDADGVYYAEDISASDVSALRNLSLKPPTYPFFAPLGGGTKTETGEGYYFATNGQKFWGKYGAAGALVRRKRSDGVYEYFLAKRSAGLSTGGGTWSTPGGAHKNKEDSLNPSNTVGEEFQEEMGVDITGLEPVATHDTHMAPDWKYSTHIFEIPTSQSLEQQNPGDWENSGTGWFTADQLLKMKDEGKLHPGFADALDDLITPEIDETSTQAPDEPTPTGNVTNNELELPVDISGWKKIGDGTGSNTGGFYVDPATGQEYYVKIPKSEKHARNEALASAFYKEAGIPFGHVFLGKNENDETVLISPIIPNDGIVGQKWQSDPNIVKQMQEGFVVDAWLENWDSVGLVYDNMIIDKDGNVVRIDPGASMLFRAQGADKSFAFTDDVKSLDSLRDPNVNPQAANIFGPLSEEDLAEQADLVANISPERIDQLVNAAYADDPETAELVSTRLKNRRQDIINRFGSSDTSEPEPTPEPSPEESEEPEEPDTGDDEDIEPVIPEDTPEPEPGPVEPVTIDEFFAGISATYANPGIQKYVDSLWEKFFTGDTKGQNFLDSWFSQDENKDPAAGVEKYGSGLNLEPVQQDNLSTFVEALYKKYEATKFNADDADPQETGFVDPNKSDSIAEKIEDTYGTSPNGDGSWTLWSTPDGKYKLLAVKNKNNSFSVITQMIKDDGTVVEVDRYRQYDSFPPFAKRVGKLLGTYKAEIAAADGGKNEAKVEKFLKKLQKAKEQYYGVDGTGDADIIDANKVKMTHPYKDGSSEAKVGDYIWNEKTGKFGYVKQVLPSYGANGYPDYIKFKSDDGGPSAPTPSSYFWKADPDTKELITDKDIPESFPAANPNFTKTKNTASKTKKQPPKKKSTPATPEDTTPSDAGTSEPPKPTGLVGDENPPDFTPDPDAPEKPATAEDFLNADFVTEKNSTKFFNFFNATNKNEYKEALGKDKVKDSDNKNLVPGAIVRSKNGSIGIVQKIYPDGSGDAGNIDVSWIYGEDAGTSVSGDWSGFSSKEVTSEEKWIGPYAANKVFGVDVDVKHSQKVVQTVLQKQKEAEEAQRKADEAAKKQAGIKGKLASVRLAAQKIISDDNNIVSGPGADPVTQVSPDFTASVDGTPSMMSVVDRINDPDVSEGAKGAGKITLVDATDVEDGKVKVSKVTNRGGQEVARFQFKLTNWAGDKLTTALRAKVDNKDPNIEVSDDQGIELRKFWVNADTGAVEETKPWDNGDDYQPPDSSQKGRTYQITLTDPVTGDVIGYADFHRANKSDKTIDYGKGTSGSSASHNNRVEIYLTDTNASEATIRAAMSQVGIADPRQATDEDLRIIKENKLASYFGGMTVGSKNLTPEAKKQLLAEVEAQFGITADDVYLDVQPDVRGDIKFRIPQSVAEELASGSGSAPYIGHSWYSGNGGLLSNPQSAFNIFFGDTSATGLLATTTRYTDGINTQGMSSAADQKTIGGEYVFFSQTGSTTSSQVVVTMADFLSDLDAYITTGDAYGRRDQGWFSLDHIGNGSQYHIRNYVPAASIHRINLTSTVLTGLKQIVESNGITDFYGKPFSEVFPGWDSA